MEKILSLHCITFRMTISYDIKRLMVEMIWRLSRQIISTINQHPKVFVIPSKARNLIQV